MTLVIYLALFFGQHRTELPSAQASPALVGNLDNACSVKLVYLRTDQVGDIDNSMYRADVQCSDIPLLSYVISKQMGRVASVDAIDILHIEKVSVARKH